MKRNRIIAAIVVVVVAIVVFALYKMKSNAPFKATYETAEVTRGNISSSVTATGTVEPITQVEVGTQVSGIVDKIYVDYNSVVKKGQVIAVLDKVNLESELASQKASLSNSEIEYDYELKNYTRQKNLFDKGLISDSEYEQAYYTYMKAKNSLDVARNNVAKAETNLGYATIYAPINGVVLSKSVEEGQTVASSFSTPTLFIIAEDLTQMRVIADVDEADIGSVVEGLRVEFTVDAYPNTTFSGEVVQVRQEATTTSNVVTYEVVINAPNNDLKLKPGLTASVTIYTEERNNVLIVPGKALHFTPSRELIGEKDTIIDCEGQNKLWTREGNKFIAHAVETGMSLGSQTEIISGINEGDKVITNIKSGEMPGENSEAMPAEANKQEEASSPFMPGRPGKKK